MSQMVKSIAPIWNRLVIFTPSEISYHGHPNILKCPPDRSRKSLALYYYTQHDDPNWIRAKRETQFHPRTGIDNW